MAKINKKNIKKLVIPLVVLALLGGGGFFGYRYYMTKKAASSKASAQNTTTVTKQSIKSQLTSSGTISPKDTYTITSLVSGNIISADFEEGDEVTEGQVLYQIDRTSANSELNSASNTLARARTNLQVATDDYNEALTKFSGNTYKATTEGYIKTLSIKEGDKVGSNTQLAEIYSDLNMEIKIPFLSGEADVIAPGMEAVLTLTETGEQITGSVTAVSSMEETLSGGRLVRYITILVSNPGGLTSDLTASATIGEFTGASEAAFEAKINTTMSADISANVEVEALLVKEGDYVTKGTPIFRMTSKTAESLIRTYKNAMDSAQESVDSSVNKVDSAQDSYDNYTITAPISGRVITKSYKVGDKVNAGSNSGVTMATIYDLSAYTFEMSVDELDVVSVAVGQEVSVEADAFSGQTFTGHVTNISLESSVSNGVSTYPVTVTLDETGSLLPGMNVDGYIILEQADDALTIPADALMRGNKVYIKDDTVTEAQGNVPAGFKAVQVETGITNDDYVQITSGVSEGDVIYVASSSKTTTNANMMGGMMGGMAGGGTPPSGGGGYGGGGNGGGGGRPGQ